MAALRGRPFHCVPFELARRRPTPIFGSALSLKMASIRALATAQNYALFLGALRIIDDVFSAETPSAIDAGDAQ